MQQTAAPIAWVQLPLLAQAEPSGWVPIGPPGVPPPSRDGAAASIIAPPPSGAPALPPVPPARPAAPPAPAPPPVPPALAPPSAPPAPVAPLASPVPPSPLLDSLEQAARASAATTTIREALAVRMPDDTTEPAPGDGV